MIMSQTQVELIKDIIPLVLEQKIKSLPTPPDDSSDVYRQLEKQVNADFKFSEAQVAHYTATNTFYDLEDYLYSALTTTKLRAAIGAVQHEPDFQKKFNALIINATHLETKDYEHLGGSANRMFADVSRWTRRQSSQANIMRDSSVKRVEAMMRLADQVRREWIKQTLALE
jgi:hypothetical protein